jgi:hypothetical protein
MYIVYNKIQRAYEHGKSFFDKESILLPGDEMNFELKRICLDSVMEKFLSVFQPFDVSASAKLVVTC